MQSGIRSANVQRSIPQSRITIGSDGIQPRLQSPTKSVPVINVCIFFGFETLVDVPFANPLRGSMGEWIMPLVTLGRREHGLK